MKIRPFAVSIYDNNVLDSPKRSLTSTFFQCVNQYMYTKNITLINTVLNISYEYHAEYFL